MLDSTSTWSSGGTSPLGVASLGEGDAMPKAGGGGSGPRSEPIFDVDQAACRETMALERAWLLEGDMRQIWFDIEEGLNSILNMLTSDKMEVVPITTMDNSISGVVGVKGSTITKCDLTLTLHKGRGGSLKAQFVDSSYFKFQHLQGCANWLHLALKAVVRMRHKKAQTEPSIPAVRGVLDDVRQCIISAKESFSEKGFYSISQVASAPNVFTPALPSSVGVTFNIDRANLTTTVFRLYNVTVPPGKDKDSSRLIALAATPEAHEIGGVHIINGIWYEVGGIKVADSMVPSLINAMSSLERVLDVTQRALLKVNALR